MKSFFLTQDALTNFKQNNKNLSSAFKTKTFIKDADRFHKNTVLDEYVKSNAKQLFNLSHSLKIYNKFNIKAFYDVNIEENLSPKQYEFYNKCLDYVPKKFDYFLLDFIASCDKKMLDADPKDFLNKVAYKCLVNSKSVLNGFAKPKNSNTLYRTIPKAFSPLFFNNLEFAGSVLKNHVFRKDYNECVDYLFAYQYQNSITNIANANSSKELNEVLEKICSDFCNEWWIPKELLAKAKQIMLYSNNIGPKNSLLAVLIIEFVFQNKKAVLELSPKEVLESINENIKKYIYSNSGNLFLNNNLKDNFHLYSKLKKLYFSLNNNKKILLTSRKSYKKFRSVKYLHKFNIA